jgi:hypothetical protein
MIGTKQQVLAAAVVALASVSPSATHARTADELSKLRAENTALRQALDKLEKRLDAVERTQRTAAKPPAPRTQPVQVSAPAAPQSAQDSGTAAGPSQAVQAQAPRVTREEIDQALRGDPALPGLSLRIPGTETTVRLYGMLKANMFGDLNARNRSDTANVPAAPLFGSAADRQGGDFQFSARRSRIGLDTLTPTAWGPLRTQLEMDFAGDLPSPSGIATNNGYMPRLRQAWAQLGGSDFSVLVGQANSLWNEPLLEKLNDMTAFNESGVRQAQIRVAGELAPGLTGMASLEMPATDFTAAAGVLYPDNTLDGGASPAFDRSPDLLGKVMWVNDYGTFGFRGLLRRLTVNTKGTNAVPDDTEHSTMGWGAAVHANVAMNAISPFFGFDRLLAMAYYGEGIGRYFDTVLSGQGAFTNLGLPGVGSDFSVDAVPAWGFIAGYRRFWNSSATFRSNLSYGYTHVDFPSYASLFDPGSTAALTLNSDMHQFVANTIWSPFATTTRGFAPGWLDVGLEFIYNRRELFGGAATGGDAGGGFGEQKRVQASGIARF